MFKEVLRLANNLESFKSHVSRVKVILLYFLKLFETSLEIS